MLTPFSLGVASLRRFAFFFLLIALAALGSVGAPAQPGAGASAHSLEVGAGGAVQEGWILDNAGERYRLDQPTGDPHSGRASARLTGAAAPPVAGGGRRAVLRRHFDAAPYRGRRIRLKLHGRADMQDGGEAAVELWLDVPNPNGPPRFRRQMLRGAEWTRHDLELDVGDDVRGITAMLAVRGAGEAWIDSVSIEPVGPAVAGNVPGSGPRGRPRQAATAGDVPAAPLTEQGIANLAAFARLYGIVRYFHPSSEGAAADWDRLALAGVERVERARGPGELRAALEAVLRPVAPTIRLFPSAARPRIEAAPAPFGAADAVNLRSSGPPLVGFPSYGPERVYSRRIAASDTYVAELGGGLSAAVPLKLWVGENDRTLPAARGALPVPVRPAGWEPSGHDRSTRLASVVIAWSLLQHFYPYFDVVDADWPAELRRALSSAAVDADDLAFQRTLRRLIAALEDGHGNVGYAAGPRAPLPLAAETVEGRVAVTRVEDGAAGIAPGDVITHLNGRPVGDLLAEREALFSGSAQWRRYKAVGDLLNWPPGEEVALGLLRADGSAATVRVAAAPRPGVPLLASRPEPVADLADGVVYVDLTRVAGQALLRDHRARLLGARGIVFDLRGYPSGGVEYLGHMSDRLVLSQSFQRLSYERPDGGGRTSETTPWRIPPRTPPLPRNVVFVTDASAISFAESVLGTVKGNRLATIVGEPTAGANGNVASYDLPGRYRIFWTGMLVTNQDGSRHHLAGVRPDIPVSRTLAGLRAGRDEMLERAVALAREGAGAAAGAR